MKIIKVISCDQCPYNTGWDPMYCESGKEVLFCGYHRLTVPPYTGEDRHTGCYDRKKPVPIPRWCPLQDGQISLPKRRIDV